jgi:large conductance mechanosensitive channel
MLKDFKAFIQRGNVIDLAVAVIIGGAFGRIVTSFVNDVLMPIIGMTLGNVNLQELKWVIEPASEEIAEIAVYYGVFMQHIVDFIVVAFFIFLTIRFMEKRKKKEETIAVVETTPADIELLREIRDILKESK